MAEESEFRIGACHAAQWFHDEVKRMVAEGKTAPEISERLAALVYVLQDWNPISHEERVSGEQVRSLVVSLIESGFCEAHRSVTPLSAN
jgi:hypothetical protein